MQMDDAATANHAQNQQCSARSIATAGTCSGRCSTSPRSLAVQITRSGDTRFAKQKAHRLPRESGSRFKFHQEPTIRIVAAKIWHLRRVSGSYLRSGKGHKRRNEDSNARRFLDTCRDENNVPARTIYRMCSQ